MKTRTSITAILGVAGGLSLAMLGGCYEEEQPPVTPAPTPQTQQPVVPPQPAPPTQDTIQREPGPVEDAARDTGQKVDEAVEEGAQRTREGLRETGRELEEAGEELQQDAQDVGQPNR